MKTLIYSIIISFIISLSALAADTTNTVSTATTNVPAISQTLMNEAVIDILRGVKTAGSEVYNASKKTIVAAVDFTKQQAPDVVEQFLRWRLTERIIYVTAWMIPILFLMFLTKRAKKYSIEIYKELQKENDSYVTRRLNEELSLVSILMWLARIVICVILAVNITVNGMIIAKIIVAPKVYLIEYVVDTIKTNTK